MRIMVVDDEKDVLEMMCKIIRNDGHEVIPAADGNEAMTLLHRSAAVDVLVTDIIMPEKEGIETIQEVRRNFPDIKVLAVSGGGSSDPRAYLAIAKAAGAGVTLRKPFGQSDLLEALGKLLEPAKS